MRRNHDFIKTDQTIINMDLLAFLLTEIKENSATLTQIFSFLLNKMSFTAIKTVMLDNIFRIGIFSGIL